MPSPWLNVPLTDYEGHMLSPEVAQLDVLALLFREVLDYCRPPSVAILGIAGGNGVDQIDPNVTRRIAGVDVNPDYLAAVRRRFPALNDIELHRADLAQQVVIMPPVALVHAALIFEHAGVERCLDNAVLMVAPGGTLSVVLQLPSPMAAGVGTSPYASLAGLKPNFALVDPGWMKETLESRGFQLAQQTLRPLVAGKSFWMGVFQRTAAGVV